jgi:putative ABC transport system permease protein
MSLRQDLVFAIRTFRRRRTFAVVAITTIALGIGAATSIYSVVDGVLFRPLPFREPARLIAVWQTYPHWVKDPLLSRLWDRISLSIPEYRDWRATQTVFSEVGLWGSSGTSMSRGGPPGANAAPEIVNVIRASASLLAVLGVSPALGRYFSPNEDVVGGAAVAMISYEAWQSRFQRDPGVLGKSVWMDGPAFPSNAPAVTRPYTIIGVLPKGLSLSRSNAATPEPPFWTPVGQDPQDANERNNHSYRGLARLKPGVSLAAATVETERILRGTLPPDKRGVRLENWQVDLTREVRKPLIVLLGAVGLLLAIACVNVAILLLGESGAREQEMAARIALGAGQQRIVGQLLTESVALAAAGALLGIAVAWAGTRLLVALAPPRIPGMATVGMDLRVLAFTLTIAAATGILFGLAPALRLSRSSPSQVFRGGGGQSVRGRGRLQQGLVAVQLALSLMLLVGAALLTRSLDKLTAVDPGFRADHMLTARVALPRSQYADSTVVREFYRTAIDRLATLPGVAGVTASSNAPFYGGNSSTSIEIEGRPSEMGFEAEQRTIVPNYFRTMEIPLLSGRTLTGDDRTGGPLVVLVDKTLADRGWPNESPLGKRVKFQGKWREIVGVVGDAKYGKLSADDQAFIYAPLTQRAWNSMTFLLRTTGDAAAMTAPVRAALRDLAPNVPFAGAETMLDSIKRSFAEERYRTMLVSLFGIIAGVLAAVGMYGVTSRAVSQRTREMGIRLALGAGAANVTGLLVRSTLAGVTLGVSVGMLGALFGARALAPFLFGVTPRDGAAFGTSIALLAVISVAASWLPARRAARVHPAVVLRGE